MFKRMPMLHGCAFPGCTTLTLSTYCVEHELLARATKESERSRAGDPDDADEPLSASPDEAAEPAPL